MKQEKQLENRILVVDPDEGFGKELKASFEALKVEPSQNHPRPMWGASLRDCQRFLSDRDFSYLGVFINPKVGHPSWAACVKSVHQYRPGVPCFILISESLKMSPAQLKQLGVHGFIDLPLGYEELCEYALAKRLAPKMPGEEAPALVSAPAESAAKATPKRPEYNLNDFVPIDIKERIGKTKTLFDLFVKLSDGRLVQVNKVGDTLTQDRLDKYKENGAENLYVRKDQQKEYLEFCDQIVAQFLTDPKTPIEKKVIEISRYGAESLDFLKGAGFQTPNLLRAEKFIQRLSEGVAQVSANSPVVKMWIENAALLEHSVGVATIAGLLLKHIGVIKQEVHQAVGMAAILHDVGLRGMPQECIEEDESKMTPEQKALFYQHPAIGAKLLASDPCPPLPGVIKAVEQHHLRVSGGFPEAKGVLDLSPIAEVVGLSEEFCNLIKQSKLDRSLNPIEAIKEKATGRFSSSVFRGLMATLREK